jgi:hypothetical protein
MTLHSEVQLAYDASTLLEEPEEGNGECYQNARPKEM